MDPVLLPILMNVLVPVLVVLIIFSAPAVIFFILRHFRLREKELEMGRDQRLVALEHERALLQAQLEHATNELDFVKKLVGSAPHLLEPGAARALAETAPPVRVQVRPEHAEHAETEEALEAEPEAAQAARRG